MNPHFAMADWPISAVYPNDTGIEFVFQTDAGSRSLTLRGGPYWYAFKEPGGFVFTGNTIPLKGDKKPVSQFSPEEIDSFQLYELRSGYSRDQLLAIRCRQKDQLQPKIWVIGWTWDDDGTVFHSGDDHLEGFSPIPLTEVIDMTLRQELFCPETYKKALRAAALAHEGQLMPSGAPYIVHVNSVAMEVIQSLHAEPMSFDEGTLAVCCALLHDTIEDTGMQTARLQDFGDDVVDGVRALTKDKTLDKSASMHDSLVRLKNEPLAVQRVKLADRITNLDPPPRYWDVAKCRSYQQEARVILDELRGASDYLATRLERKISNYDCYIEEFSSHRYLLFLHAPRSEKTVIQSQEKEWFLLCLDKQASDYFIMARATLKLSNNLYRQRDIVLFEDVHGDERLGADYRVADEVMLEKMLCNGYRRFTLQQVYNEFLAKLYKTDEWLQDQIQQWVKVCGIDRSI